MIRLIPKNEIYIGQSKNVSQRIQEHRSLLRHDKHLYKNGQRTLLQKSWNKYGEDNFEFKLIEFCEENELNIKEQYWISYYECNRTKTGKGFNLTDGGDRCFTVNSVNKGKVLINDEKHSFYIFPEELDDYLCKGYKVGLDEATKLKRSGKYWSTHKKKTLPQKPKIKKERIVTEETRKKLSERMKQRHIEHPMPEEQRIKIKERCSIGVDQFTKDNILVSSFSSMAEAEQVTKINKSHICQCCKGQRKTAGKYIWRYHDSYI